MSKEYTGCINSIEKARDFTREMLVYGLKPKDEFINVSPRAYDEITRQMRDWFPDAFLMRVIHGRKKVKYISLNCRMFPVNPLYRIWKTCSFTANEITFFFYAINYLAEKEGSAAFAEIYRSYYGRVGFQKNSAYKWLNGKGCPSGIFLKDGKGKYSLAPPVDLNGMENFLLFYSEIAPGGVIGSFVLDNIGADPNISPFRFKQHYIGQALDCEVICNLMHAIKTNRDVMINYLTKDGKTLTVDVFPVKIYSSTQNGRQYAMVWDKSAEGFCRIRIDAIKSLEVSDDVTHLDHVKIKEDFRFIQQHTWGVSWGERVLNKENINKLTKVELSIKAEKHEAYIIDRFIREKRCGTVSQEEDSTGILLDFKAEVYDAHEMFPWIRSFICRIVKLTISDSGIENMFWESFKKMNDLYC